MLEERQPRFADILIPSFSRFVGWASLFSCFVSWARRGWGGLGVGSAPGEDLPKRLATRYNTVPLPKFL
jgi:hypothetical protein